jgi:hypothetical protein
VIDHSALSIFTAHSNARINALVPDTSLFVRTVFIVGTLRSAAVVGITKVFWITSANTPGSRNTWAGVRSTRIWLARVHSFCWFSCASNERISNVVNETLADWIVVDDVTFSVLAARSWAGISAFGVDTSQGVGTLRVDGALGSTGWR